MDRIRNPFSPGAGTQPPELSGRSAILDDAAITLARLKSGRHDRSSLLIGLRGVGKTVLLNRIQTAAETEGYLPVTLEAPEERKLAELLVPPLRSLLLRLDRAKGTKEKLRRALSALSSFAARFKVTIGDVGIGLTEGLGVADSGILDNDVVELIVAVGEAAAERQSAVAVFIDELQYVKELELGALLAGLHRVGQLNLPVVMFGAGLPQLVGLTGRAKSYAERLFKFQEVGPLNETDALAAVREPIEREGASITHEALGAIVDATEGYPYFLQEWGSHAWNGAATSPIQLADVTTSRDAVIAALDQGFFRVRLDRLTPAERDYLRAMAELGPGGPYRSGDVAAMLGRQPEQVAPVRAKIIQKGMAFSPSHGDIAFTVPMFDAYMRRVIPQFTPRPPRKRGKRE
jgi:hypothetical protein